MAQRAEEALQPQLAVLPHSLESPQDFQNPIFRSKAFVMIIIENTVTEFSFYQVQLRQLAPHRHVDQKQLANRLGMQSP